MPPPPAVIAARARLMVSLICFNRSRRSARDAGWVGVGRWLWHRPTGRMVSSWSWTGAPVLLRCLGQRETWDPPPSVSSNPFLSWLAGHLGARSLRDPREAAAGHRRCCPRLETQKWAWASVLGLRLQFCRHHLTQLCLLNRFLGHLQ
jgi:hypothetical protein